MNVISDIFKSGKSSLNIAQGKNENNENITKANSDAVNDSSELTDDVKEDNTFVNNSKKFRFVIEHIDFFHFCKVERKIGYNVGDTGEKRIEAKIDAKTLRFIGKTYDFLRKKHFNPKFLKKLENSQYFERVLWANYNIYDNLYILSSNKIFFSKGDSNEDISLLYIKHILSLIVFICYKYEEKGKHEIWDQIIYNRIDEFEKLVEIERNRYSDKENDKINERYNLYKEFLIHKFNSLFYNTVKLINCNFVFSVHDVGRPNNVHRAHNVYRDYTIHDDMNDEVKSLDEAERYMGRLVRLSFLEKAFIIQFFINVYASIDKKFLFRLCLEMCNPFIWNYVNYDYLNTFLFKKNKEAKMLFHNLTNMMRKKYLNGMDYKSIDVYTSNCEEISHDDTSADGISEDVLIGEEKEELKGESQRYDENTILFVNKNEFFYNLINYFLIVLDQFEHRKEYMYEIMTSNSTLSSTSDSEMEDLALEDYEKYMDDLHSNEEMVSPFSEKCKTNGDKLEGSLFPDGKENSKEVKVSLCNNRNYVDDQQNCDMLDKGVVKKGKGRISAIVHSNKRVKIDSISRNEDNYQDMEESDFFESYLKYASSEGEGNELDFYVNHNEYKKEEILEIFLKYENNVKIKSKEVFTKKSRKKDGDGGDSFLVLFVEKCLEFFIDLLSQLYSRRILYIFMKYFNVLIYCKISNLNRKRKFKELIKLLKYYIEMYINNFSGNPLTYIEINNEHYENFEHFQSFCYKHFKDHKVLKNYYLKSVFLMDKKKELFENFSKLEKEELLFLCTHLKYVITKGNRYGEMHNGGKESVEEGNNLEKEKIKQCLVHRNIVFENVHIFMRKRKLFYITLLIENLSFKKNIFEDIDKQCDYPNEKDLFENVLIDTKDDCKKRKKKTFLYTKPLFKLNLQYLCINDYIFRIYNLFKLQSYYDIRKDVIEYVYETNPKNKKVNERTICNYVFEIDEGDISNRCAKKKGHFEGWERAGTSRLVKHVDIDGSGNDDHGDGEYDEKGGCLHWEKKRKHGEVAKEDDEVVPRGSSTCNLFLYNEYQLNSIVHDINKVENTYFANERRMSNKIDSFKIVNVDDTTKKVIAEIVIDLKYKYYERVHNEWNMIKPTDILFLVCVKNYTNYYKNKINVVNDGDLKKLLGINYVRGCEVFKYTNFAENNEDIDDAKCSMKKITVYLDYLQYQQDIINAPEIYSSFNLLIRRKQKENNFFYILNNIKTLIMNPDDAVIPHWVHDIFLGYCNGSIKYYQEIPSRGEKSPERDEVDTNTNSGESGSEESSSEESGSNVSGSNVSGSNESGSNENGSDESFHDENNQRMSYLRREEGEKMTCNKATLNFIRKNMDDINYLNTFLNIKHVLHTTNVAYVCIDSSHVSTTNGINKTYVKNLLNEYIEPLFLSYVPIMYESRKKYITKGLLEKNALRKNVLESLYYHICVINKYTVNDISFVSEFISNVRVVYHYESFYIFHFDFKNKNYFLILNNYLSRVQSDEKIDELLAHVEGRITNEEDIVMINEREKITELFDRMIEHSIKHISMKDGIYRIQNKIYEDQNYPLEGLLLHTTKKNSTNVKFANKKNDSIQVRKKKIHYTERQIECIKSGIYEGFTIIEGVPGSGKTSILNKIINILFNNKKKEKILICTHSNSCLNYIFNLLVKENLIHQKYLCRVGMGELDIENLRSEYEEIERNLNRDRKNSENNSYIVNTSGNAFIDEDDNFNFSKYGRINYMIDLREKLLSEVNLLSESVSNNKIYNCLTAVQYYENNIKGRISKFFTYVDIFKKNSQSINQNGGNFFEMYISNSIDEYDTYNLFLCHKMYVTDIQSVEKILWKREDNNVHRCKETEKMHLLEEDKNCFYFVHPQDQLKVLNLSIYNVLFPFKRYVNLKLEKVTLEQYLDYKSSFTKGDANANGNAAGSGNGEPSGDASVSTSLRGDNQNAEAEGVKAAEEESVEGVEAAEEANVEGVEAAEEANVEGVEAAEEASVEGVEAAEEASVEGVEAAADGASALDSDSRIANQAIEEPMEKDEEAITGSKQGEGKPPVDCTKCGIFTGDICNDLTFDNSEDDFYVSKYYLAKIIRNFEHLNDCRAFEVLKSQRERGIYIIAKLARVIAMTCTHASINRSKIAKLQFYFDNIIIDECTQITENDTFLPLLLQENRYHRSKLKRIIFVGDSNQLPPIIKNKYIKNYANYEQSLYKRFLRLELPSIYLNEQGRMRNEICNVYKYFYSKYNIQIENLECIHKDSKFLKKFNPGFTYTYQFIHVESEEYTPVPYFYQNLLEAEMTVAIFMYMRLVGYSNEIITILTTYNGQKELILDILKKNCLYNKMIGMPKKVTTVDKYQGKQNDYVIISLVRSKSIGYMKNVKRLIVAFSRARFGLYVLGNYNLYKNNYEFKKPLYFFKKNKLELSLQTNEHFNTTDRSDTSTSQVIVKDLNQFYGILYSLSNAHLQRSATENTCEA
ncbi:hypothetical protein POVCU1_030190 [Plasmodium ovale curtisi]|uniref:P-loop containing nucleoside triphosphate hydrolase n=1 Tax=Plasmodium ovale curtisi TaxID=864141 RepID=A0A1A8WSE1_PLAOA|nr:hypothetical protein POVCU1_030190 [Plasmodium ovale curtisi]